MNTFTEYLSTLLNGNTLAILGGALAALGAGIGSAKGVGIVGAVASGSLAEDPSRYGKLIILQAIPGSQGIYGLIVWFISLFRAGVFTGGMNVSLERGALMLVACLPTAFVGYYSAISQANVAADGVTLVSARPETQSKAIVLAAMVETYAIFALLVSVFTMFMI